MLRSVKQKIKRDIGDNIDVRRAFNTVLRGGDTALEATMNALATLNDEVGLKSRYKINMGTFNPFHKPSEPRMVYMLGYLYYMLCPLDMRQVLILDTVKTLHEQVRFSYLNDIPIKPYEYWDDLETKLQSTNGQTRFHRQFFDGSLRLVDLMAFLDTDHDLEQTSLTIDDFETDVPCKSLVKKSRGVMDRIHHLWPGLKKRIPLRTPIDLNKVTITDRVYYDGESMEVERLLGQGNFGEVELYKSQSGVQVAVKTYFEEDDEEITLLKTFDFDTCNIIGLKLIESTGTFKEGKKFFCAMTPASGSLSKLVFAAKTEKVAKKVTYELAKIYECMIRRHGLYYFDIKTDNALYTCDDTGSIKVFGGDIGGFCNDNHACAMTLFPALPYEHVFVYRMDKKKKTMKTVSLSKFMSTIGAPNIKFDETKVPQEGQLFLKIPNVYKRDNFVMLPFDTGEAMFQKYQSMVQADKTTVVHFKKPPRKSKQKAARTEQKCVMGDHGRCKFSDIEDGNCHYFEDTKRCRKNKKNQYTKTYNGRNSSRAA